MLLSIVNKFLILDNFYCCETELQTLFQDKCDDVDLRIDERYPRASVIELCLSKNMFYDFDTFTSFIFIRNPWERIVLLYENEIQPHEDISFYTFVKHKLKKYMFQKNLFPTSKMICNSNGQRIVNVILPVENKNLIEVFFKEQFKLNITFPNEFLQRTTMHYSHYYNSQELIDIIKNLFQFDIQVANYEFESKPIVENPLLKTSTKSKMNHLRKTNTLTKLSVESKKSFTKPISLFTNHTKPKINYNLYPKYKPSIQFNTESSQQLSQKVIDSSQELVQPSQELVQPSQKVIDSSQELQKYREISCQTYRRKYKNKKVQTEYDEYFDKDDLIYLFQNIRSLFNDKLQNEYSGHTIKNILQLVSFQYNKYE